LLIGVAMVAENLNASACHNTRGLRRRRRSRAVSFEPGMTADQCMRMLGQPARIKRISGSKNEQWTYKGPEGPVILHFESGRLAIILIEIERPIFSLARRREMHHLLDF
jgi:hypothetical protein